MAMNLTRGQLIVIVFIAACLLPGAAGTSSPSLEQSRPGPQLVMQTGHSSRATCVVFSPDGRWLASGGADNSIRLWDSESGLEIRALLGHQNWVRSLAVSSNGELLASGSNDRTIKLWNVSSGEEIRTLFGHNGVIEAVLFTPDGRAIISASSDQMIGVWDVASGRQIQTLRGHGSGVTALAITSDGKTLASADADGSIKIWNLVNWTLERTLNRQTKKISILSFSPDNRLMASAGPDNPEVVLWDSASGKSQFIIQQTGVVAAAFVGSTDLLITTNDRSIVSLNTITGKQKSSFGSTSDAPNVLFASFAKDGKLIAAGSGDRSIEIRNRVDGQVSRVLASHAAALFSVAFSRDGRWLAAGTNDHTVRLYQVATGRAMPNLSGHTGWVQAVAFSPNSQLLASGSNSGEVRLWDVNSGREIAGQKFAGDQIHAVGFSEDGNWLAAVGTGRTIHLFETRTQQKREIAAHDDEITCLSFVGPAQIATGSTDRTVRLWDLRSGNLIKKFPLAAQVNAIAISPDGNMLAAGIANKTVELLSLNSSPGDAGPKTIADVGEIFTLAFSRDGHYLASAGLHENVTLWDPKTGDEIRTLAGPTREINGIDFSGDSRFLASANADGSMMIWRCDTPAMAALLVSVPGTGDWLVATPSGLFDGSQVAWKLLLWRFGQSTFKVAPVESFFNEFYYPGLLADVLANKNPKPKQELISKDRRQPIITMRTDSAAHGPIAERMVRLALDITEAPADAEYAQGSGARDLRLFRNGLLVRAWADDILQGNSKRTIETTVPIVAGENEFTAYVFNRDNVKSRDAVVSLLGANELRRTGTAYLLVVGVSKYANAQYNLHYSGADATEFAEQLKRQQELLRRYQPVQVISLLDENATKENILLALRLLAGNTTLSSLKDAPPDLLKIKPAQPEDAVVFYFSGHGTAKGDRFYLIPYDLGYNGLRTSLDPAGLATILSHGVSDQEIEEALKPIDADQLLLVIDACNSGQALNAADERRGPMNARGLAQLAYEKGIYVLTASQSDEVAFESAGLKHSYLAYALLEEGIKSGAADADRDGQIFLNEWFNYATDRVPRIRGPKQGVGKELEEVEADETRLQRPRVFNMRQGGAERFMIARLAASTLSR